MGNRIEKSFSLGEKRYAKLRVDVNRTLNILATIPAHCWQGDDAGGFEDLGTAAGR
ncbi:MAG TPA: L-rhamnose isomerase [Candidatus Saccharimonadales bacterium]|nr:L-rhamnose isomerase [Candidatus Saccharimonadales bacterium]